MIRIFSKNENGATAIEYGLIAGLIALVIIAATQATGLELLAKFTDLANKII